ncbi:dihydroorotate dehydrogenase electron transfer subunit [Anaerosphaera multitolerans]|uniref:Dihydroorotate dehydrogenase electron transfer subunit n=1 Tax=Anaerosphaera multitolerans TaxID=2487351 RepID=A0A437S5N8_9FIRM|nr:dihydroorotate dehydrogenase electron transfer subunit [Anaerosphaera multitolerans]RVU54298.1 dihydroorotate dehydrogenase electron transfer subunit [Anaerosphaera multitolerans]
MGNIISNEKLSKDFYLLKAKEEKEVKMGQFYMLRSWDYYPLLSRPISIYDSDGKTISFLYKVVGEGTELFAKLKPGDEITLQGPLGESFPEVEGKIAMVGGGVGIAPLYLASKTLKELNPENKIDIYLGFSDVALLEEEYGKVCDNLKINVGGFVTDDIEVENYDHIFTCGPEIMMKVLYEKCKRVGVEDRLTVSMESRMACGVGACFGCTCKTTEGNKKVCKDGPIFSAKEVFEI